MKYLQLVGSQQRRPRSNTALRIALATIALSAGSQLLAQGVTDMESLFPEDEGRSLVMSNCSSCHSLGLAIAQGRTATGWAEVVDTMRGIGAMYSSTEEAVITQYLTRHFPPLQLVDDRLATAMAGTAIGGEQRFEVSHVPDQWPTYGGGHHNQNYSPLTQITKENVNQLEVAWVYRSGTGEHQLGDRGIDYRFEVTPLIIGGVMYISTPQSPNAPGVPATIAAVVPETGELIWKFESPFNIHGRGIAYWPGSDEVAPRIIFGTEGGYIMAVDVTTGTLAPDFGLDGMIDAYIGVSSEIVGESRRSSFTVPNPVSIYGDLFIASARPGEGNPPGPRGDLRAFDARTGRLVWTFHVLPRPGEPHYELHPPELNPAELYDVSGANVWSTMTLDEANGIIYAPTGDLNARLSVGTELFSSTLLAIDAASGELIWHRQITNRDMWDWDSPTPVVLLEWEKDGETVPAVLLTGKHGLVFLFNRLTGESLNGFEQRPTPRTNLPGVDPWPTQPFPTAPGPVSLNGMTRDQIPDYVPGMRAHCEALWDQIDPVSEGLYALPHTDRWAILGPGTTGGPNWGGGSYDPESGYYFINNQNRLRLSQPTDTPGNFVIRNLAPNRESLPERPSIPAVSFNYEYKGETLSCMAGPIGELVAVDVQNLEIAWRVPLGNVEALGEEGRLIGVPNLGGNIVTASGVVFIGATNDSYFRAFDSSNGDLLWETRLPAGAHATPVTYMGTDGYQYVAIVSAGGTSVGRAPAAPTTSDTIIAFRLPR